MDLTRDISVLLVRELEGFQRELELFPDDESVWRTSAGVSNSAGNLALHIAGNLQHFIGAVIGRTGYVRNREAEFGTRSGSRRDIIAELKNAALAVQSVLPTLNAAQLDAPMSAPGLPAGVSTRRFLLQLCVHASYHLGQAGYLRRLLTADARTTGAVGFGPLAQ